MCLLSLCRLLSIEVMLDLILEKMKSKAEKKAKLSLTAVKTTPKACAPIVTYQVVEKGGPHADLP